LRQNFDPAGQRIVVLGGGQTGAEIVFHLLSDQRVFPEKLTWVSRRSNFVPLDESAFTNELFTPSYSDYFFGLSEPTRRRLLDEQKLASNGISTELLLLIYRRLYELKYLNGHANMCRLLPCQELMQLDRGNDEWVISCQDILSGNVECIHTDVVILCTGFEYSLPSCLEPLADRLNWEGDGLAVRDDFSIEWDGPEDSRIYVQNAARHKRGIADPNLSLMAWRSAIIANSVAGHCVYDIRENDSLFEWLGDGSVADNERIFQ
jgi:lysine N6-hydroxylase